MKKVIITLLAIVLLTGCGKKDVVIKNITCEANNDTLGNLVTLELEFHDDELYFMKQIQTYEYESEAKAIEAATNLDANSYLINDSFKNIKAYTEVEGSNVLAITEHQVHKFTQEEMDAVLLTDKDSKTLVTNFTKKGYKCEENK